MMSLDDPVAAAVRAEWCALLEVDQVDDVDDFFDLGGNSMLALALVARVEDQLSIVFPLEVFFVEGTFGALVAACVSARAASGPETAGPGSATGSGVRADPMLAGTDPGVGA